MLRFVWALLVWAMTVASPLAGSAQTGAPGRHSEGPIQGVGASERAGVLIDPGGVDPREAQVDPLRAELQALRERVEQLEESLTGALRALHAHALPGHMEFAHEPVPLDRWDTRERLERELLLSLGNRGQVVLWLKRSARYFPYIQAELRKAGLPDDLKYVAVIESALLPTALSHADALGIWQFIASTARRYGLAVTPWWDQRRDPQASTAAALVYLRDLHGRFRSWALALAGYNAGEGRVEDALRRQGVSSYYQLALSAETERYVFRALAAKLILSEPARYGFHVPSEQLYRPHEADVVEVQVRTRMLATDLARASGSFYREIKELNPEIVQDSLPKGRYLVRIPKGRASHFATNASALGAR